MKKVIAALGLALALAGTVQAADVDPLNSSRWPDLQREYLNDAPVAFDPRIEVLAPKVAEDSMNVPVTVRLKGLPDVKRVLVIADFNPIVKVLDFQPLLAQPGLSFRIKLQQASPIRASLCSQAILPVFGSIARSTPTWSSNSFLIRKPWPR